MKQVQMKKRVIDSGKLFGVGGTYTVEDTLAKKWKRLGYAKLIKDLGDDAPEPAETAVDNNFLEKVRVHASQIIDILQEEAEEQYRLSKAGSLDKDATLPGVAGESSSQETNGSSQEEDEETTEETASDSEGASDEEVEPGKTPLPEGFPGKAKLEQNDNELGPILYLEDIPRDKGQLMEITGIGERLANQIGVSLANLEEEQTSQVADETE